jgi:NADH:ubiquinone oxidoreductase subunit 4 (subunit M)
LKIGTYGLFRFISILKIWSNYFSPIFSSVGVAGAIIISITCLRQVDLKRIVAYSSVVHIGTSISGLFSLINSGRVGCLIIIFSHGIRSPLMFIIVYEIYCFTHSRSVILTKGAITNSVLMFAHFMVVVMRLGFPPMLPFFSEILSRIGLSMTNEFFLFFMTSVFFLSGVYLIYFFSIPFHGLPLIPFVNYSLYKSLTLI